MRLDKIIADIILINNDTKGSTLIKKVVLDQVNLEITQHCVIMRNATTRHQTCTDPQTGGGRECHTYLILSCYSK